MKTHRLEVKDENHEVSDQVASNGSKEEICNTSSVEEIESSQLNVENSSSCSSFISEAVVDLG